MKGALSSFQSTLVRGVFLLAPLMVLGILIAKALGFLQTLIGPLASRLDAMVGIPTPVLLATLVLILICFLAGLVSTTRAARRLVSGLESAVLMKLPGYAYMKGMSENMAGVASSTAFQAVLARIEDAWQLGYIVETIEPGQYAVFVPGAPSPWSGSVYFMAEDRIRRVDLRLSEVQGCLKRLGIGTSDLLRGKL